MGLVALFSAATLIALAIQTTIPHWLPTGMFVPDLVMILAVDLGMKHHGALPALMAFGIGYATDAFAGTHPGFNAFVLTLVFLLAYALSRYLISTSVAIGIVVVFIGVLIQGLFDYVVSLGWQTGLRPGTLVAPVLIQAVITAFLTPWVLAIMSWAKRSLGLRQISVRE
ncbi:MAG TPA: rod shape-determining protein MreD [Candidatus Binataceae bacterium]|nr:rod shape-determining protein MreD [Candidatus Binataceae bacterium]